MLVRFDQSTFCCSIADLTLASIVNYLESKIWSYGYAHEVEALRREAKKKKISTLQRIKSLTAIIKKPILNVKQHTHETHFITENILTQTTYYKTLTSRP